MKPSIVFLDADSVGKLDILSKFSEMGDYQQYGTTLPEQRKERIKDHSIVITNKVDIDQEIMDACPELKLICIAATGMNNVDLDYAEKKGVIVKNVAGYSTESVAQSTFSMLFYLLHSSSYYDQYVKNGEYAKSPIFTHIAREYWELKGKSWGIIGLGTIGKRVAQLAQVFGCTVSYYSTSGKNKNTDYPECSLEELLQNSDIISIHCPLNEKTLNMLNEEELKKMKPGAYLLNMGRGGIVNEAALTRALNNEQLAGAGIDVLTEEPINPANPLLQCQNPERLFVAPHIAWASKESRKLLLEKIMKNIRDFVNP